MGLEVAQTLAEGQHQTQEYEALLNIKVKLEAEIATYSCSLKDGKDFSLNDALDSSNSMQTVQRTTIHKVVDDKVVSKTNDTRVLRH